MNTNGDKSLNNTDGGLDSPLPDAAVEQQLYLLQHELHEARSLLAAKEKRKLDKDAETQRIAKILKVTLDSHATRKDHKISRRAFTFTHFDGRKIGNVVLSWLSQFDDYFLEESFSEKDKIKCAANHLMGKASLWWNVTQNSSTCPTTWDEFQKQFKLTFLPPQFHLQARRSWSSFSWIEGETVSQYTDRFWQRLLLYA